MTILDTVITYTAILVGSGIVGAIVISLLNNRAFAQAVNAIERTQALISQELATTTSTATQALMNMTTTVSENLQTTFQLYTQALLEIHGAESLSRHSKDVQTQTQAQNK